MNIEDCIARIKDEIGIINDELGEIVKHQEAMRTDVDWIKNTVLPRIEKEVWAIIVLIIAAALAVWFLK